MKNAFKYGFLALAIAISATACKGGANGEQQDSTMVDKTAVDSAARKADSAGTYSKATDTTQADSAKQ
jgi:hypothetical protein